MECRMDDNGDWKLDIDLEEMMARARRVRLDGEQLHEDILHRLFCELTDEELQALAMDFWTLARDFEHSWKELRGGWLDRLRDDAAWRELWEKMGEVLSLLEGLYGGPLEEIERRMEGRAGGHTRT